MNLYSAIVTFQEEKIRELFAFVYWKGSEVNQFTVVKTLLKPEVTYHSVFQILLAEGSSLLRIFHDYVSEDVSYFLNHLRGTLWKFIVDVDFKWPAANNHRLVTLHISKMYLACLLIKAITIDAFQVGVIPNYFGHRVRWQFKSLLVNIKSLHRLDFILAICDKTQV